MERNDSGAGEPELKELKELADQLSRSLVVEEFGYYLTGGAADDRDIGRTAMDAKATLERMVARKSKADALRAARH